MSATPPFYELSFGVEANTGHGEVVYVCGSCPSLGSKDPSRALRLSTDPATYPLWSTEPVPVPLEQKVTYRYCVVAGGKLKRWEDIPTDRALDPVKEPSAAQVMVEDVLDKYKGSGMDLLAGIFRPGGGIPQGDIMRSIKFTAATRTSLQFIRAKTQAKKKKFSAITTRDGMIVVSFFLPVLVSKDADGNWAIEWDYESLLSLHTADISMRVTRVGFVRYAEGIRPDEEEDLARALQPFACVPVFLEKDVAHKFYRDFCKGVLWPVFHHVVDVYGNLVMRFFTQDTLADLWQCYANVNRRFRDKIVEVYNEGDMVWVHGFHLLLLPSFLTRVLRTARVGLFLHTPWPSSEIFRTLPFREDLLRGMLNADQIGFHLFEYSRHFLTCCKRILGLNEGDSNNRGNTNVFYNGRCVSIESVHGGIEPDVIKATLAHPCFERQTAELRHQFAGRFVFVGIDKVERLKGLQLKFTAFYKMLLSNPQLADKVVLLQVGISVHEREEDYTKSRVELQVMADKVNSEFAPSPDKPVLVLKLEGENTFKQQQRLPYLCVGDCLLNTAVRDGLNQLPMEYVLVHQLRRNGKPGVMMLSEFTSCMRIMRGAIRINPWKVEQVAKVMAEVVEMIPSQKRAERHMQDLEFVTSSTTSSWAAQILTDLKAVGSSADRTGMSPVGLGLNFRVIGMESNFSPLDVAAVMRSYRPAKRRAIFLDFGGTVQPSTKRNITYYAQATKQVQVPKPCEGLKELLRGLCDDPRNLVFVISGKEKDHLGQALGDIKNLGIAAEHGLHFRFPGELRTCSPSQSPSGSTSRDMAFVKRKWETLVAMRDQSWKELTRTIMNIYAQRTHGTYVENKGSALLWQFRDADPEFGWLQSKELEDHLVTVLKPFSLEILRGTGGDNGGGYIEVRPKGVNKGAFVQAILSRQVEAGCTPDFILAMGDEESDEMMFEAVKDFSRGVMGEAPTTPDTVPTSGQGGPTSPRRRSYQVGAAAVLIASAAAELQRQAEAGQAAGVAAPALPETVSEEAPAMSPPDTGVHMRPGEEKVPDGPSTLASNGSAPVPVMGASKMRSLSSTDLAGEANASSAAGDIIKRPSAAGIIRQVTERWREGLPTVGSSGGPGGIGGILGGEGRASPFGVQSYTCTVGKKPSQARNYVNDVDEVLEVLGGLVKVSSSVARNYSTSHLHEMRPIGGGFANYDDLSILSAQFHAAGSGEINASGHRVLPLAPAGLAVGGVAGITKSLSVVVMPTHHLIPPRRAPTAPGTMTAYFDQIEEEDDDAIFF